MDKVRMGIVGVQHFHVFSFLETFSGRSHVELVGVVEAEPERYARLRKVCDLPRFESFAELVDRTRPDAVALYNKPTERAGVISECARLGIHVWADKPVATTAEDLGRVKRALAQRPVALMVTVGGGYGARSARLKQMLESGELGELAQFVSVGSHRFQLPAEFDWERPAWASDWREAGGLILEMAIHGINEFRWLAGSPIVRVSAAHGNKRFPEFPHFQDHCAVLLEAASGAQALIQSSWLTPTGEPSHGRSASFVFGSKGFVEMVGSGIAHGLQAQAGEAVATVVTDDAPPRPFRPEAAGARRAAEDFLAQVRSGERPLVDADFFLETMRVALLAREAAERGQTIRLNLEC
jgi:predicted dehydrogenase